MKKKHMKKIHPNITDEQHAKIHRLVEEGNYSGISEVIRDALRELFKNKEVK